MHLDIVTLTTTLLIFVGDTGFQIFKTAAGYKLGVGICWDQWFPECARSLALQGQSFENLRLKVYNIFLLLYTIKEPI